MPTTLKLFGNMLIAANTSALAIFACFYLIDMKIDYWFCLGIFLAARVILFMANRQLPLTEENIQFMSRERILWASATLLVAATMIAIKLLIQLIMQDVS